MKWYVFHENVFPNNSTIIENQKMEMVQFNKKKKTVVALYNYTNICRFCSEI